jgi:two-component system, sensor histidine kinase
MNANEYENSIDMDQMQAAQVLLRGDRWMATLAHELRNPLCAMILSLEELGPFCAANHAAKLTHEIALDTAQHLSRLIDDAMELCRARRDQAQIKSESVDLVRIVVAAIRNSQHALSRKHHDVTLALPLGKVSVQGHATRMEQIVTNLLTNSANYTNPNGRISIAIETACDQVTLRVRDNGIGLAPENLTRIFEPYWKGPSSDGLGIGLALVKSLVELHGGSIAVYSDGLGKGAEFVVRLPSGPASAEQLGSVNAVVC